MAYDEGLAQRIRELLEDDPRIREKKMFGGVAFLANGHMAAGIIRDELMVRVGPDGYERAIAQPHARAMDFTGRPMRGFVQVAPAGFEDDADLSAWLARGVAYAEKQEETPLRAGPARAVKRGAAKPKPGASARASKPRPKRVRKK
jgi:TfoX/Sxy family transcriptional regulator of competence genes